MDLANVTATEKKFSWYCSDCVSMSRLDRFLLLESLILMWKVSGQWIGDKFISDHCPIWLIRSIKDWRPKVFRFINGWLEHSYFRPFVSSCWAGFDVHGNKAYVVKEKLKLIKAKLRGWNKELFGVLDLNIENVVKDLNVLDNTLVDFYGNNMVSRRKEISAKFC